MRFAPLRTILAVLLLVSVCLTPILRASQAGKDMVEADAEINAVYKHVLESMPNAKAKTKLRESQRAWVAFVDGEVALAITLYDEDPNSSEGSKGGLLVRLELTQARIKQLKAIGARQSASGYY
jgi:uncharacterized protein YecT (DUF1311 family)